MAKKIFEIEWDRKFQQDKINDVISQLKNNLIKVRELPTEVKWCECGEPEPFSYQYDIRTDYVWVCKICNKKILPEKYKKWHEKGMAVNPIKPQPKVKERKCIIEMNIKEIE